MYICVHVKCPLFKSDYNKTNFLEKFSRQIFEKYSSIKFHENPSSNSRVVPCRRTNMTKLIVFFRNFAINELTAVPVFQEKRSIKDTVGFVNPCRSWQDPKWPMIAI